MRHFELVTADQDAHYGLMTDFDLPKPPKPKPAPSTDWDQPEKNYGVDISTLAKLIEDGAL